MGATVSDICGIKLDSSLETGRGEEKNLQEWLLEFLEVQETGTRLEQKQEKIKLHICFS